MNTSQLRYFDLTYRELNFSAAARRVPMSAQGLAKSIHSLETELGVSLFEPSEDTPGRLHPTSYAHEMATYSRTVMDARYRLDQAIARLSQATVQTIRLAVAIGSLGMLGMDLVPEFRRDNPGINVVCDDLPDKAADEAVLSGDCSLGLTVLPAPTGLRSVPLVGCERYVWVHADDPLAARGTVTLSDLAGRRVALVGPQFKQYDLLTQRLGQQDVAVKDLVTASEMIWLHQFAKDGAGVAFTAKSVLPLFLDDRSVAARPFADMPYEIGVTWADDHALTPAERDFVRACKKRAAASEYHLERKGAAQSNSSTDEEPVGASNPLEGEDGLRGIRPSRAVSFLKGLFHHNR